MSWVKMSVEEGVGFGGLVRGWIRIVPIVVVM
jgi:hypothetical protein